MKQLKIQSCGEVFSCETDTVILKLVSDSLTVSGSLYILATLEEVRGGSYYHYLYLEYDETLITTGCLCPSDVVDVCCLSCEGFYLKSLITDEGATDVYLVSVTPVTDGSDGQYIGTMSDATTLNIDLSGLLSVIGTDKYVDGLIPNPAGSGTGDDGLFLLQFNDATTLPINLSPLSNVAETVTSININGDFLEYTDENGTTHSFLLPHTVPTVGEDIAVAYAGSSWQSVVFVKTYTSIPTIVSLQDDTTLIGHNIQIRNITLTGCEIRVVDQEGDSNAYNVTLQVGDKLTAIPRIGEDIPVAYTGGGYQVVTYTELYPDVPTVSPLLDETTLVDHNIQIRNRTSTACEVRVIDGAGETNTYNIILQIGDK